MSALLAALAVWLGSAVGAWLLRGRPSAAAAVGVWGAVLGGAAGLLAVGGAIPGAPPSLFLAPWSAPFGAFSLRLDPLAGAFLAPVCLIGALGAIYGAAYLRRHGTACSLGPSYAAYNLLLVSLALVTTASNTVLLLAAWEVMTVASYALIVSDHESADVRAAGFQYLIAGHLAGGALVLFFVILAAATGTWETPMGALPAGAPAGLLLLLALIGFGTKAALVPLHVWLPDAHAAAPSHVSALLSGVMITMGFYGLARFLPALGPALEAAAYALMALGAAGALLAIALALTQRDVKRILAYSTVENAGLAALALGVGLLGRATGKPALATLGLSAALLHLWNHAAMKGLLFLGVGAAAQSLHDRNLEAWGGVLRRAPLVATLILLGGAALAGLPGLNGFAGEWLLFRALFEGELNGLGGVRIASLIGMAALAVTAALALSCYVRLLGVGLLGSPRGSAPEAAAALPPMPPAMVVPMLVLAAICVAGGLAPALFAHGLLAAVATIAPTAAAGPSGAAIDALRPLGTFGLAVVAVTVLLLAARRFAPVRSPRRAVTWDCGYEAPGPSMQVTASSLAEPATTALAPILGTAVTRDGPTGFWPRAAAWRSETPDPARARLYGRALAAAERLMVRMRRFREPSVTTYLRYVALALLIVLALLFLPLPELAIPHLP